MIVIDSSALVAILRDEPERRPFIDAIVDLGKPRLSAAAYVEASMVMELRLGDRGGREIDVLMEDVGIAIVPVDQAQAKIAREAFRRFGKGRHRASLNFGDCFVYALARTLDAPVLFKGNDFTLTDLKRAL
ncbi:MAG TPA: type II toxin-antitoxin system VapC family toxin [Reyranella sp.]|nr:type II toxin-antitoxin system VapC family toxin [Reyranella sp.]